MLRKDLLRKWMAAEGLTLGDLARRLGMTPRTLYNRMRKGDFRANEMECMIYTLHITNPCEVFFDWKPPQER